MDGARAYPAKQVQIRAADRPTRSRSRLAWSQRSHRTATVHACGLCRHVPSVELILSRIAGMHVLVALVDDQVAGTIAGALTQQGDGHLRGMAVLPQFQGLGIASRLLVAIEDYLRTQVAAASHSIPPCPCNELSVSTRGMGTGRPA